jgi:hypothetical protein
VREQNVKKMGDETKEGEFWEEEIDNLNRF